MQREREQLGNLERLLGKQGTLPDWTLINLAITNQHIGFLLSDGKKFELDNSMIEKTTIYLELAIR